MNCENCNIPMVQILYGRPTEEGMRMVKAGERTLGGCMEGPDYPTHECSKCGFRFLDKDSELYKSRMAMGKRLVEMMAARRVGRLMGAVKVVSDEPPKDGGK
jgi:predicted enzyme related to lactoylglutathione lyase